MEKANAINNKMFRRSLKNLPTGAKALYGITLICAITGLTMLVLDFLEIIESSLIIELLLCNAGLWVNIFLLNRYRDEIREEGSR